MVVRTNSLMCFYRTVFVSEFFAAERLGGESKYECERCCGREEAERVSRIRLAPRVLVLHLKRFKYHNGTHALRKVSARVAIPRTLRLPGCPQQLYALCTAVIHVGATPLAGHYVTLASNNNALPKPPAGAPAKAKWWLLDDEVAGAVTDATFDDVFGALDPQPFQVGLSLVCLAKGVKPPTIPWLQKAVATAYILMYQAL